MASPTILKTLRNYIMWFLWLANEDRNRGGLHSASECEAQWTLAVWIGLGTALHELSIVALAGRFRGLSTSPSVEVATDRTGKTYSMGQLVAP